MPRGFRSFLLLISLFVVVPVCRAQSAPQAVRDYVYGPGGRLILTAEPDVYPPTPPLSISAFLLGQCASDGVEVDWDTSSTDIGSGVAYYYLSGGSFWGGAVSGGSYDDYGLQGGVTYTYSVYTVDNAGNASSSISTSIHVPLCMGGRFPWNIFTDSRRVLFAGMHLFVKRKPAPASSSVANRSKKPGNSGQSPSASPAPSNNKLQPISFDLKRIALPIKKIEFGLIKLAKLGESSPPLSSGSSGGVQ